MANVNLKLKGLPTTDDDVLIQLTLLQPTVTGLDKTVTIGPAFKTKQNGQRVKCYTTPRTPSSFAGGSIDFSTYAGSVPTNQYVKATIAIDSNDNLQVYLGAPAASEILAPEAPTLLYQIAVVTLQNISGTLQNITDQNIQDRRPLNQINGAPVYFASGDELITEQYLIEAADQFHTLPGTSGNTIDFSAGKTSTSQYAAFSVMTMSYSTGLGNLTGGNSVTLNVAPSFTVVVGNYVNIGGIFARILTVNSQTNFVIVNFNLITSNTSLYNQSNVSITVMQAVYTQNLYTYGSASLQNRPSDVFTQTVDSVIIDYDDGPSNVQTIIDGAGEETGAGGTPYVTCLAATTNLDTQYTQFLRPTSKAGFLAETYLTNPAQSLQLVFLPNATAGSGSVTLLGYSCFFIKDPYQYNGGIFNQAYGFTDQATGLNCSFSVYTGFTLMTFTNNFPTYIPGINPNSPYGDLIVMDNGVEIPRRTVGVTDDSLTYYTELSYNQILLWGNFSASANRRQIAVVRRYGTVNTNDQNALYIANLTNWGSQVLYSQPQVGCSNGQPVIFNGASFTPAQANSGINSNVVGVIVNIVGGVGDIVLRGTVANIYSGLLPGNTYYLDSATPGGLVTPIPSSGILTKIGLAISPTLLYVNIERQDIKYTALGDRIVGSALQVALGQATDVSIQSAHNALSAGQSIYLLPGTYTENPAFTKEIHLRGAGRSSVINGSLSYSAAVSNASVRDLKISSGMTIASGSVGNQIMDVWVGSGQSITDSNAASYNVNYIEYMRET